MAHYSGGGGGGKLSAVDAILAEAADLVALEQIAKLNTAHLSDDSALPSSLEARFRKLKSLPSPAAPTPVRTLNRSVTAPGPRPAAALRGPNPPAPAPAPPNHHPPAPPAPAGQEDPPQPPPGDAETKSGGSSPREARAPVPAPVVHDADVEDDAEDLERLFGSAPRGRPTLRERNRGRNSSSTSASRSPSPRRQACCFGFSPKKPLQRTPSTKSKQKKVHHGSGDVLGVDVDEWCEEDRKMVTELREQQRRLRKALQDQVQVSRETAKMARWVKQASARMTHVEAIDDLLSDCEDDEELK